MLRTINKASSPLTPYRGKHELRDPNGIITALLCVVLLFSSSCTGFRACSEGDPWFGQDKMKHFLGSAVIAAGGTVIAANNTDDDEDAALIGLSAAMATGLSKELYDNGIKQTCFSWKDLIWDFLGASVGATAAAAVTD